MNDFSRKLKQIVYPRDVLSQGDCNDIQGLILRRYPFYLDGFTHFLCRIVDLTRFREKMLTCVQSGLIVFGCNDCFVEDLALNISFTYQGLERILGLSDEKQACVKQRFEEYLDANFRLFKAGLNLKTALDLGEDYALWEEPFKQEIHVILSFSHRSRARESEMGEDHHWIGMLESSYISRAGLETVAKMNSRELPGGREHFGFRDGIAQPWIDGGPKPYFTSSDIIQRTEPWTIVLRDYYRAMYSLNHPDFDSADHSLSPARKRFNRNTKQLFQNGSFAAFRKLRQDVAKMEDYLGRASSASGFDNEWLAARVVGRWKNGSPIALFPKKPCPDYDTLDIHMRDVRSADDWEQRIRQSETLSKIIATINGFTYNSSGEDCPYGAHIRRNNPRNSPIAGRPDIRRIVRRAMSYGVAYKSSYTGSAHAERGLMGFFICAKLDQTFQHLHAQWMNDGRFTGLLPGEKDPLLGNNPETGGRSGGIFTIQRPGNDLVLSSIPRFVEPKGGVYCFFPSLTGLTMILNGTFTEGLNNLD